MLSYVVTKKQILNSKKALSFTLLGLILTVIIFVAILVLPFVNKIYPNIYLGGVYVGDKTKNDAVSLLQSKSVPQKVTLNVDGIKYEILVSEILNNIDYKSSVDRAYNLTNSGSILGDLLKRIKLVFIPEELSLNLNVNEAKLLESVLIISSKTGGKHVNPTATVIDGQIVINAGQDGFEIDEPEVLNMIRLNLANLRFEDIRVHPKKVVAKLNSDEIQSYNTYLSKLLGKKINLTLDNPDSKKDIVIDDNVLVTFIDPYGKYIDQNIKNQIFNISKDINRNSQNSVFIVEEGLVKEFVPSKDGLTVNQDLLLQSIKDELKKISEGYGQTANIVIPVITSPAKIKNEDVNNLGIKTLIGTGFSNFKGSIPNRIHNVNLAQSKFKGVLIPPNEVVSFNNILGDVSSYTGYKSAYVIMDGKTVLGDGGGVCQVSTTLFRAVLAAGLPVIERRAHAYRVGYYEQGFGPGLDATVYSPTTDFKFKNDTPEYLLIQPSIDLNNLTLKFDIYGTSDGRVSTISKPVITSQISPAEDMYVDDPTLPTGTIKQIEHKAWGAKVIFDYKVERNGEVLIDQKFVSNYRPWQAVYLRGTKVN